MATLTPSPRKPVRKESFSAAAFRHVRAQVRFLIAIAVGIATALLVATVLSVEGVMERTLAGWNAGGWLFLLLVIVISLSISTILLSWLLIHTMFAAYYAHEFHGEKSRGARGNGGGLDFPGDRTPDYVDFLYFSFVVGTTAQTSDVEVTSRSMRFVVMLHGILSFFFNTAVIALTVNLAAQLVQG